MSNDGRYTAKIRLHPTSRQSRILDLLFMIANSIYNLLLDEGSRRLNVLRKRRDRRDLIEENAELSKVINAFKSKTRKIDKARKEGESYRKITREEFYEYRNALIKKRENIQRLNEIKKEMGFTKYGLQDVLVDVRKHFSGRLPADPSENIAEEAWKALDNYSKGKSHHLKYRSATGDCIIWSKRPNSPFKIIADKFVGVLGEKILICHGKKSKPGKWYNQVMAAPTKRVGLKREKHGDNYEYYVLMTKTGRPPKSAQDDEGVLIAPEAKVIIDPGPSAFFTMYREDGKMRFACYELCQGIDDPSPEINRLCRKAGRSRRASNPQCFDETGAPIKGARFSKRSRNYEDIIHKIHDLSRLWAIHRQESHRVLAKEIVSHGSWIVVDRTDWAALAKRSKETSFNKANGRANSKKRFGKSILKHAPAMLLRFIEELAIACGGDYEIIDSRLARTSQYDHVANAYDSMELSQRWKEIGGVWVQRDCYSLFYMDHLIPVFELDEDGEQVLTGYDVDRDGMIEEFDDFLEAQSLFMEWVDAHGSEVVRSLTQRPPEMVI